MKELDENILYTTKTRTTKEISEPGRASDNLGLKNTERGERLSKRNSRSRGNQHRELSQVSYVQEPKKTDYAPETPEIENTMAQ